MFIYIYIYIYIYDNKKNKNLKKFLRPFNKENF